MSSPDAPPLLGPAGQWLRLTESRPGRCPQVVCAERIEKPRPEAAGRAQTARASPPRFAALPPHLCAVHGSHPRLWRPHTHMALTGRLSAPPSLALTVYPAPHLPILHVLVLYRWPDDHQPQRSRTGGDHRIHFFIAGRLFLEQTLHRPYDGGQGAPTCGGGRRERGAGTGSQQAWPGTVPRPRAAQAGRASSQGRLWASGCGSLCSQVGVGPEAGEAWRGRTPGRLCYQGVSLRKGADPCPAPPSLAPSRPRNHSRVGEGNASSWQPRNPHRMRGLGVLGQAAASSSVARPRARRSHAHTHTPSLTVCFGEQSQEQRHCHQTGHRRSLLPPYSPTWSHDWAATWPLSLSPTRTGQS